MKRDDFVKMKLVIISGAGLSTGSKLPTYDELSLSPSFAEFFSANTENALVILENFLTQFDGIKPNKSHYECVKLEIYCSSMGIEFEHYTLNIDDLMEQACGRVTHVYGCINDLSSVINARFSETTQLDSIEWHKDDILLLLGISNNGYPLPLIEAKVIEKEGTVFNYNLVQNELLTCQQVIGDLSGTFESLNIQVDLPIQKDEVCLGDDNIATLYQFIISGRNYGIYFSSSIEHYTEIDRVEEIESAFNEPLTRRSSEIKFDLMDNFTNPPDVHFNVPDGKVFSLRDLNKLGHTICSIMYSHGIENKVDFFTASAARPELNSYYKRLAVRYCNTLKYEYCVDIDLREGNGYVIKTDNINREN